MLLTFIALQSLWRVWQERRQRALARMSLHQLSEIGVPNGSDEDDSLPFWRAVLARCRKEASRSESRRTRARQAMFRLSRIVERRQATYSSSRTDMRRYAARRGETNAG